MQSEKECEEVSAIAERRTTLSPSGTGTRACRWAHADWLQLQVDQLQDPCTQLIGHVYMLTGGPITA
jgi:hypothetical protein